VTLGDAKAPYARNAPSLWPPVLIAPARVIEAATRPARLDGRSASLGPIGW